MDLFLIILALFFMFLGILGSFLPILPGPITSWVGLLLAHFTEAIPMDKSFIIITFVIAVFIWLLDYIIPAMGAKRFGGTRFGMIGTTVGLFIGILAPVPCGIIIGPFLGALFGELINKSDSKTATKAALGSFIGFLASTFVKFIVAIIYFGLFVKLIWEFKSSLF